RIGVTDPRGNKTTYSYDPRGNIYLSVDALAETTRTVCDYSNSPVFRLQPYGKTTTWTNDPKGNPTAITDPRGFTTNLAYNPTEQVTDLEDANHHHTKHQYDGLGNRTQTTNDVGNVTTFGYDPMGRRISMTYPALSLTIGYAYDANDSLLSVTDGEEETTS